MRDKEMREAGPAKRILILTGGSVDEAFVKDYLAREHFDHTIVVDGALAYWDRWADCLTFDHLVGDFDTISREILAKYLDKPGVCVHRFIPEKDNTDTDIAIKLAMRLLGAGEAAELRGEIRTPGTPDRDPMEGETSGTVAGTTRTMPGQAEGSGRGASVTADISASTCAGADTDTGDGAAGRRQIVLIGATGSRLDHMLANLQLLEQLRGSGIEGIILDAHNRVRLLEGGIAIPKTEQFGDFISLIPVTDLLEDVTLTGFKYPLSHGTVAIGTSLCVSNEITADAGEISIGRGRAWLIESRD